MPHGPSYCLRRSGRMHQGRPSRAPARPAASSMFPITLWLTAVTPTSDPARTSSRSRARRCTSCPCRVGPGSRARAVEFVAMRLAASTVVSLARCKLSPSLPPRVGGRLNSSSIAARHGSVALEPVRDHRLAGPRGRLGGGADPTCLWKNTACGCRSAVFLHLLDVDRTVARG